MPVWRICARRHARAAYSGAGAKLTGGRWNPRGTAVVYTSATLSLAALELLVHLDPDTLPDDLVAVPAEIPDSVAIDRLEERTLPRDWRSYPAPDALADLGLGWIKAGKFAVLAVPSVVVPKERNYLLNPGHSDFAKIRIGDAEWFHLDPRLRARAS
ncbi:MAG: RES family NAD+ phosphorylase [Candidatus Binatia bacterium]